MAQYDNVVIQEEDQIKYKNYLDELTLGQHEFTQEYVESVYYEIKPSYFERFCICITRLTCTHSNYTLCKYKLVRSRLETDIGTSREYQYIKLNLHQQCWKCTECGLINKASVSPVPKQYREEHYL